MTPSNISPYVWNLLLNHFDSDTDRATRFLSQVSKLELLEFFLNHAGIIGYSHFIHHLHTGIYHPQETP